MLKTKFRIGQTVYIHSTTPGKVKRISLKDDSIEYIVEANGKLHTCSQEMLSFFKN